jgi:diguanylate cyclase (GGDEF)-like protein
MKNTVLIIDGSPFFRAQTAKLLEENDYRVLQAGDAPGAFLCVDAEQPDLVLLSMEIPGMNGLDIYRIIRERERHSLMPVMMLAAKDDVNSRLAALALGANDYLVKPLGERELIFRIRNTLRLIKGNRSANPLTGLPGNIDIQRELSERLRSGRGFTAIYLDIDNFKAFNDRYGFLEGDSVLSDTAKIVTNQIRLFGNPNDFVGHVGGDDFVIFSAEEDVEDICLMIARSFDETIRERFSPDDMRDNSITTVNRKGQLEKTPLTSVSMAIIPCQPGRFSCDLEVSAVAAELKFQIKEMPGSGFVVDRRK